MRRTIRPSANTIANAVGDALIAAALNQIAILMSAGSAGSRYLEGAHSTMIFNKGTDTMNPLAQQMALIEAQIRNARYAHAQTGGIEDNSEIEQMVAERDRLLNTTALTEAEKIPEEGAGYPNLLDVCKLIAASRGTNANYHSPDIIRAAIDLERERVAKLAKPDSEKVDPVSKHELRELIDQYWALAYLEGVEGRETDTENGAAGRVSFKIQRHLNALYETAYRPPTAPQPTPKDAEVAEWRDIAGAPKDGTPILISDGEYVSEGFWMSDQDRNHWRETGWFFADSDILCEHPKTPTHYQPLPLPPTTTGGEGK